VRCHHRARSAPRAALTAMQCSCNRYGAVRRRRLCQPSTDSTLFLDSHRCSGIFIPAPNNIMFDKRVVRGNTYAAQILPAVSASPTPRVTRPSSDSRESKLARGRAHVSRTNRLLLLGGSLRLLPLTPRRVRSSHGIVSPPSPHRPMPRLGTDRTLRASLSRRADRPGRAARNGA
jgi:hypothetical protein